MKSYLPFKYLSILCAFALANCLGCQTKVNCEKIFAESNTSVDLVDIESCLSLGLNPNAQDQNGRVFIELALDQKNEDLLRLLLNYGADPFILSSGGIPCNILARTIWPPAGTILEESQLNSWVSGAQSSSGDYLQKAIEVDNAILTSSILSAGFEADSVLPNGIIPLAWAAFSGNLQSLNMLIRHGADPNAEFDTRSALIIAAMNNYPDLVNSLCKGGADVDNYDGTHTSALMFAAEYGYMEIANILLKYGADKSLTNLNNKNAFDIAQSNGHSDLAKQLVN